jgi:uncharacterized protein (TIGR02996 family)
MYLQVTAVPEEDAPARLGERFTPRPDVPLRIGPGRGARIRLKGLGEDLEVANEAGGLLLRAPPSAPRASLAGVELTAGSTHPLREGDTLYVHPGLALEVRERPPALAREPHLEARLHAEDDDSAWTVYADFLEERGDRLAEWIRRGPAAPAADRLRQLGPLADAVRGGVLDVAFTARGFLEAGHLSRQAVVGAPGLAWHLAQLSALPVARFLRELTIALFAGAAPAKVDDEKDPDALAASVLERLARADFAPGLRRLSLGFVKDEREWTRALAAFERLRAVAPHLESDFSQVLRVGGRARLVLVSHPPHVTVVSGDVTLNPGRSDVGVAPSCLVRLVGDAPAVACSLHRMTDGQWVVFDQRADPFSRNRDALTLRVNGAAVSRAPLSPGDLVEPVPGLVLRLVLA